MANGAGRIFNVMKQTSEETNTKPSLVVRLIVKSINPLILIRDDRLEITEEFCVFNNYIDKKAIQVGDILDAFVFNEGQVYYIEENINKFPINTVSVNSTQPTANEKVWIKKGKNLIKEIINGLELYTADGSTGANSSWCVTNYIEVVAGQNYIVSGLSSHNKWWYDSNYRFIGKTTTNPSQAPINAKYVRMNSLIASVSNPILVQGTIIGDYESYIDKEIFTKNENGVFEKIYNEADLNRQDYSYGEQKVGTWINGKPLYRKTFKIDVADISSSGNSHGINNVDTIFFDQSASYNYKNGAFDISITRGNTYLYWIVDATKFTLATSASNLSSNLSYAVLTVLYTKTTD